MIFTAALGRHHSHSVGDYGVAMSTIQLRSHPFSPTRIPVLEILSANFEFKFGNASPLNSCTSRRASYFLTCRRERCQKVLEPQPRLLSPRQAAKRGPRGVPAPGLEQNNHSSASPTGLSCAPFTPHYLLSGHLDWWLPTRVCIGQLPLSWRRRSCSCVHFDGVGRETENGGAKSREPFA